MRALIKSPLSLYLKIVIFSACLAEYCLILLTLLAICSKISAKEPTIWCVCSLQAYRNIYHNGAEIIMYKSVNKLQHSFLGFNQPRGLHMPPGTAGLAWQTVSYGMSLKGNIPCPVR